MLKLHGFQFSNYVSMVQLALLEKDIAFDHLEIWPDRSDDLFAASPRGKVPFLETPNGFLWETSAILDYLEDEYRMRPLLPPGGYERAVVRSLMKALELYVELPARACFGEAFAGQAMEDGPRNAARRDLLEGIAALKRAGQFAPYLAGDRFSLADIVFVYTMPAAIAVARLVHGLELLADFEAARTLLATLRQRPHVQAIAVKRENAREDYFTWRRAMEAKLTKDQGGIR